MSVRLYSESGKHVNIAAQPDVAGYSSPRIAFPAGVIME